ncbi:MAG: hypothetical protein ACI8UR_002188 [Natronomonas sp.]|uniref:hypothetical protein n=1 Tax=Natronomonas sp. TaxID=2184060 RepID=UPI003989C714
MTAGDSPLVAGTLRVIGVLLASLVIVRGIFSEPIRYAVVVGLVIGLGFALAAYARRLRGR